MPYEVKRSADCPSSKPWAVVKEGGERMGCHETKEKAARQVAAIEANEGGGGQ